MLREAIDERSPAIVHGFRHRGHHHVSRIEGFSDAVFGFSLTLLVVSLQVPQSFAMLESTMASFPAFAISFAFLAYIWFLQYHFFRRYALEDGYTIALNVMLLFVIVFFTYPLKFMFRLVFAGTGSQISDRDVLPLFAIYGGGYGAVFAIFVLLYVHAFRTRKTLGLTVLEVFDTRAAIGQHAFHVGIAALSVGLTASLCAAKAYDAAATAGGFSYFSPHSAGPCSVSSSARNAAPTNSTERQPQ